MYRFELKKRFSQTLLVNNPRFSKIALLLSVSLFLPFTASVSAFSATPSVTTAPSSKKLVQKPVTTSHTPASRVTSILRSTGVKVSASHGRAAGVNSLLEKGNAAASRKEYPEAISLYEQAAAKAPADKNLKSNLAVLYANYAGILQDKPDYNGALRYYDKALTVAVPQSADAVGIQSAKAGLYYSQAMALRSVFNETPAVNPSAASPAKKAFAVTTSTPSAASPDYAKMKSLLEQAIVLAPTEPAFRRGMASVYLDQAYDLAIHEQYTQAAPLLEQAMTYDSESPAIRQSLANVYLGLARKEPAHRQDWIKKALAVDNSPQIQQTVQRLNSTRPMGTASATKATGKKHSPGNGLKMRTPKDIGKLSVLDMIREMENTMGTEPADKATLQQRLETTETSVLGGVQTGPMAVRAKNAYTALMGTPELVGQASNDAAAIDSAPMSLTTPADGYLDRIFKVTDGKVVRWGKFPLRVYIDEPKDNPLYKSELKTAALAGLEVWKTGTGGFTNFVEVKNPLAADIQIQWSVEPYSDRFATQTTVDAHTERYRKYKAPHYSPAMKALQVASMVTPGYFSLAPQALNAAMQYKEAKKLDVLKDESIIHLGLATTKELSPEAGRILVQNMAAQEFGHVLGLKGESPDPADLMHGDLSSTEVQLLSARDLETLRALYDRPANIVLNFH
jgi:tetratricopeptide (TPR) repeat protein